MYTFKQIVSRRTSPYAYSVAMSLNNSSLENFNMTEFEEESRFETGAGHKATFLTLFIIALFLNTTSCVFASRIAHLKPTWPHVLVVQLEAVDLSALMFGINLAAVSFFVEGLLMDYTFLCKFQAAVLNVWFITAHLLVLCITLDRMVAITFPFTYSKTILSRKVSIGPLFSLLIILVFALFLASLPLMLGSTFKTFGPAVYCLWDPSETKTLPVVAVNVIFFVAMLVSLLVFTVQICVGICKLIGVRSVAPANQFPSGVGGQSGRADGDRTEVNFFKLAVVIALTYAISNLPFTITLIIEALTDYNDPDIMYVTFSILLLTMLINPIIHGLVRRPIRHAYLHLLHWMVYALSCDTLTYKPTKTFDETLGLVRKPWQPPSDVTRAPPPPQISSSTP